MITLPINLSESLIIRLLEQKDLESARTLHNDHSTLLNLYDITHVSEVNQSLWFDKISRSNSSFRYSILNANDNEFVGIFKIDNLDHINKSVCFGLDINKKFRGRGYSKKIYKYFISFYFDNLGMNRIYLSVLSSNILARKIYKSLGFIEEGNMREAIFRDGHYVDLIFMSILKHEYLIGFEKS